MVKNRRKNEISVEEILAFLKNTGLPTIIVEGTGDIIVYRRFERMLEHVGVDVFSAGGREKVLKIFERRNEIPASVRVIFIVDKDIWVNTGIPLAFENASLLFTDGYSIENDVYRDGQFWELLSGTEFSKYEQQIEEFIEWYALALARHLHDQSCPIKLHPKHVLDPKQRPSLLALAEDEEYPSELRGTISADYKRLMRGKSLFNLLIENTNSRRGGVHHTSDALFESVAARPGSFLLKLCMQVENRINELSAG
ncbi:DUF4435 domain-containing protein [Undibacterium sp. Ji83W]|uniref:DUF4435 domain-containing protein n=1 Tax=Undibacterium sp. Ji83W TaxID=3413043 RepID=UPI003BF03FA2